MLRGDGVCSLSDTPAEHYFPSMSLQNVSLALLCTDMHMQRKLHDQQLPEGGRKEVSAEVMF